MKKVSIKRANKKRILFLGVITLVLITALSFTVSNISKSIQIRKAHQGDLMFYVMDQGDIEDENIVKWIMKNYQNKGIYTYDTKDEKYILLATGEQEIENIDIKMESVVGFQDKILINGRVEIPRADIEDGLSYPHTILRIERDPRDIELGTLNLYDVYRDFGKLDTVSLETGIVSKIIDKDKIEFLTFYNSYESQIFKVGEEINESIKEGDILAVDIDTDDSKPFNEIKTIRDTSEIVQGAYVESTDEDKKEIYISLHENIINYKVTDSVNLENIINGEYYILKFEKIESKTYISEIIGL